MWILSNTEFRSCILVVYDIFLELHILILIVIFSVRTSHYALEILLAQIDTPKYLNDKVCYENLEASTILCISVWFIPQGYMAYLPTSAFKEEVSEKSLKAFNSKYTEAKSLLHHSMRSSAKHRWVNFISLHLGSLVM